MSFYILILTDSEIEDAFQRFNLIKRNQKWPIYITTNNKDKLKSGDNFLVYIAGKQDYSQSFIAMFTAHEVVSNRVIINLDLLAKGINKIHSHLGFNLLKVFPTPICIYSVRPYISFLGENNSPVGAFLRGGCKKISSQDFQEIIDRT